ncbi:MAG: DUF456 domain-containing protein [Propionicimonas sp.]
MNDVIVNVLVGLTLLVAAAGIVVPVLPGTVLAVVALVSWAILTGGVGAWSAVAVSLLIIGLGQVLKYLVPGKSMTSAGIPGRSIMIGGLAAIVGFFVIPIVGILVGFVAGVYVAEHLRLGDWDAARTSTAVALRATGLSIVIELTAVLMAAGVWGAAVAIA